MKTRWLFWLLFGGCVAPVVADPVLARWGTNGEDTVVEVRGFDSTGMLRIAPTDGAQGEALLPVSEVGDLRFIFSETYREARLRLSIGRPAEALFLLQQEMPGFVPFAVLAESNVPAAIQLYLRLLQQMEKWPEAVAVGAALTQSADAHPLTSDVLNLIQSLIRADRVEDAAWLLGRVPMGADSSFSAEVERVAAQLRRSGYWAEARNTYQRLLANDVADAGVPWSALAAYCAWHLGEAAPTAELLAETGDRASSDWEGLVGLLRGRLALANGDSVGALDSLSEALINASAGGEWRLEITAVLAECYAAHGQPELAQRMQAELQRLYPDSPWTISNPNT